VAHVGQEFAFCLACLRRLTQRLFEFLFHNPGITEIVLISQRHILAVIHRAYQSNFIGDNFSPGAAICPFQYQAFSAQRPHNHLSRFIHGFCPVVLVFGRKIVKMLKIIFFCSSHYFQGNIVAVNDAGFFVKNGKAQRRGVKDGAVKIVSVGYFTLHVGAYNGVCAQENA